MKNYGQITSDKDIVTKEYLKANSSKVSVSATGTSTSEVNYITINGVEKKLPSGGSGGGIADVQVNGVSVVSNNIANVLLDSTPTQNSTRGVTSGGVYNALQNLKGNVVVTSISTSSAISIRQSQVTFISTYFTKKRDDSKLIVMFSAYFQDGSQGWGTTLYTKVGNEIKHYSACQNGTNREVTVITELNGLSAGTYTISEAGIIGGGSGTSYIPIYTLIYLFVMEV